jgi:2-polyprenyl-3-methyl-5-hydroxy-6-metoxy-1,4-benzoquinol methylase
MQSNKLHRLADPQLAHQIPDYAQVLSIVTSIFRDWWPSGYADSVIRANIVRTAWQVHRLVSNVSPNATVCDVGGGWGVFAAACAAAGMRSILVDDFKDNGFFDPSDPRHRMPREFGVEVVNRDVITQGLDFGVGTIDAFTSFDSIEHWHGSPKRMLHQMLESLTPGGLVFLGAPNCVNLRKRVTGLAGRAKWSSMGDWYECEQFRGHVREPDVDDFRYIARDLGLSRVEIVGRKDGPSEWPSGCPGISLTCRCAVAAFSVPL